MCGNTSESTLSDVPTGAKLMLDLSASYDATFDRKMRWLSHGWVHDRNIEVNAINGELLIPQTGNYLMVITSGAPGLRLSLTIFEPNHDKDGTNENGKRTLDVSLGQPMLLPLEKGTRLLVAKTKDNTVKPARLSTKLFLFWQEG